MDLTLASLDVPREGRNDRPAQLLCVRVELGAMLTTVKLAPWPA
ncbi:hypothetical protein Verru16b_02797 [Lacunisphaera limnophila]|uniref:Uncharacterized protein n=1 Tax=Lacunisphaera limnophila TaxID=1838286 RepID=A0A1D8AXV7_9BACT|nr:hypothetical protein Verru16b_02797 [Lacunisphaera limnophila]